MSGHFFSFLYSKLCGFRQKWHSHSSTRDDEIRSNIFIPTISKGYHLERAALYTNVQFSEKEDCYFADGIFSSTARRSDPLNFSKRRQA